MLTSPRATRFTKHSKKTRRQAVCRKWLTVTNLYAHRTLQAVVKQYVWVYFRGIRHMLVRWTNKIPEFENLNIKIKFCIFFFFFHSCTVHLHTIKSRLLSNGCTIKYSKKNVKIYIKINIKMFLHVINIKVVNWNTNMSLKTVRQCGCIVYQSCLWCVHFTLQRKTSLYSELYTSQTGLINMWK